jgi:hypothetical protein
MTAAVSTLTALLHRCSRLSAAACLLSVCFPFALLAFYRDGTQSGAILVALLAAVPAAGAALLFLTAATAYSLARDSLHTARLLLLALALGCSVAGVLPWLWFASLGSLA